MKIPVRSYARQLMNLIALMKSCTSQLWESFYISLWTRPDITFAVCTVAKYTARPTEQHWKHILRYLPTMDYFIRGTVNLNAVATLMQTGQEILTIANLPQDIFSRLEVLLSVGKQSCVALSTAEAEYIALPTAAQEAIWLCRLLSELKRESMKPTTIYKDNQSAICLSKNPQFHGRSKHIDI